MPQRWNRAVVEVRGRGPHAGETSGHVATRRLRAGVDVPAVRRRLEGAEQWGVQHVAPRRIRPDLDLRDKAGREGLEPRGAGAEPTTPGSGAATWRRVGCAPASTCRRYADALRARSSVVSSTSSRAGSVPISTCETKRFGNDWSRGVDRLASYIP